MTLAWFLIGFIIGGVVMGIAITILMYAADVETFASNELKRLNKMHPPTVEELRERECSCGKCALDGSCHRDLEEW